jgi:outer membrane biosynthesis protein TonB
VRVTSTVELTVVIAKDGEIQDIDVISGDPRLVPRVVAAVNDWVYKPTLLDNVPVEVITRVNVTMNCGGR